MSLGRTCTFAGDRCVSHEHQGIYIKQPLWRSERSVRRVQGASCPSGVQNRQGGESDIEHKDTFPNPVHLS